MKVNEESPKDLNFKSKSELIAEIIELKNGKVNDSKFDYVNFDNSTELVNLLVNNSHDGLLITNDDYVIEFANNRVYELTDLEQSEVIGQDFRNLLPPNSQSYVTKSYNNLINGKQANQTYELPIITKNNESKIFEIRPSAYKNQNNEIKILSHLRDITDKRATEEVIRQSEEKFRTIVENSHLGIVIIDSDYKFEYVNNQFLKIIHSTKTNLVGSDFRNFISKDSFALVVDRYKRRQQNIPVPSEYIIKMKTIHGEERIVKISSTTLNYSGKVKTIAQFLDVTEEIRKEKLENTLLKISQAVNEVKNLHDFLKIVRKELTEIIDTKNFYVALYDRSSETYSFPYEVDEFDNMDQFTQIDLKDSLTDYVRRTNKALLINYSIQKELIKKGEIKRIIGRNCPVWLGAPLLIDNVAVGVIALQNYYHEDAFNYKDLEVLKIVSENVSSAIWRKLIVDKLTQSEIRYKDFIAHSSEGIYRIDFEKPIDISLPVEEQVNLIVRTSSIAECNDMFLKMYGFENMNQVIGKSLLDFYGNDFKKDDENYNTAISFVQNKYKIVNAVTEELNSKGEKIFITNNTVGVVKDGYLIHTWGLQADITEKKKVEDVLRQIAEGVHTKMDESFFKSIAKFLGKTLSVDYAFVLKINDNKKIAETLACWNEDNVFENIEYEIKNSPSELVLANGENDYYNNLSDLFPNDEFLKNNPCECYMGRALKNSNNNVIGIIFILYKNKIKKSELVKSVLNIFASKSSAEIERLNYENELVKAKNDAERSNKLKTDFLAQMSHEIRTPVNTILSFSSLIKENLENQLDDDLKDSFKIIENGGTRLIRTIDLILNVSQLQSGNLVLSPTKEDLVTTLNDLVSEFKHSAMKKGLDLSFKSEEKSLIIFADHYTITQIFANLIHNAIKYTDEGNIKIVASKNKSNKISVQVTDTGVGMSEEFLTNIFDPFSQEETGYTRKFEGTGLGLTLVRKYCELNNAEIIVASKKNHGSTFVVKFN